MTITIQENTDLSIKGDVIQDNVQAEEVNELFNETTTRLMLLSESLCIFFGREQGQKIANICQFLEEAPDNVKLAVAATYLSKNEKNNVCEAIRSVYGNNVKISIQSVEPKGNDITNDDNKVISLQGNFNWIKFKEIIKGKDNKLFSVLDHKLLNVIDKPERLIIKAVSFFIDHIVDPWSLEDLKEAVIETNVILELHITDSLSDNKNPIIYIPEKILKEKEIRRQKMIADFNDKELLRLVEKAGDVERRNSIYKKTT